MTRGLYLLLLMGVGSLTLEDAAYMLVLGMGIGGVMQVLVIIVQNGVPHSELGVATSVPPSSARSAGRSVPRSSGRSSPTC